MVIESGTFVQANTVWAQNTTYKPSHQINVIKYLSKLLIFSDKQKQVFSSTRCYK